MRQAAHLRPLQCRTQYGCSDGTVSVHCGTVDTSHTGASKGLQPPQPDLGKSDVALWADQAVLTGLGKELSTISLLSSQQ